MVLGSLFQAFQNLFKRKAATNDITFPPEPTPKLEHLLQGVPEDIGLFILKRFDAGAFSQELLKSVIAPLASDDKNEDGQIEEGTYAGTQLALTEYYDRIEQSYASWFHTLGIEPIIPQVLTLEQKASRYLWSTDNDYPPHLKSIPSKDRHSELEIFDKLGLVETATLLPKIVPKKGFLGAFSTWLYKAANDQIHGTAYEGLTISDVEKANRDNKKTGTDVMRGDNIGLLPDWWSDARFSQQYFTGTNPTTIGVAPLQWTNVFKAGATKQGRKDVVDIIDSSDKLYYQDYSYLREAVGIEEDAEFLSQDKDTETRYACASVTLFSLSDDGKLHPLAIIIDWKGDIDRSVVVFNKRLQPSNPYYAKPSEDEKNDWPWRYAKTCAQVSDGMWHEISVHLTHTHLIEEAVIVAANRTLPPDHPVFRILEPHWFRTLSLNAAARNTLVPSIILDLVGMTPVQAKSLVNYAYDTFNFTENYVPEQLKNRGFEPGKLDEPKLRNYAYGRNIVQIWDAIHVFVTSLVSLDYADEQQETGDKKGNRQYVSEDQHITSWCAELQDKDKGRLPSFPTIKTRAQLIDALTMSIHIASPQHTAVNYLQNFYQSFVIAKPPALYTRLPTTLTDLNAIDEKYFVKTLPISRQREWLLAAQVPWLLSFRVAQEYNLVTYAASVWNIYKKKGKEDEVAIKQSARTFYQELRSLIGEFAKHSNEMDEGSVPYVVMDPNATAVSILI
ncbi:uncharacterized protein KY384_001608 [Bacidia gigantensis]|uniref:uncharacterized protein n=1 Tax=Bacidia gigantensis TaxID=2732470 RepID=UPI001D04514B|nr:uncharacterized protein KY384_001608 [Bacidia gigantensis]KAG8533867.1 hypothetical protein KY384_001608 [Bacidia gigantensis]